ncbi:MAG: hypothetical protein K2G12_10475, partial [Prevotella sp.]|nr:hypothetical protein [Prevotella sp.]
CSAVGSVLRSGRRGRQFESGHPDKQEAGIEIFDAGSSFGQLDGCCGWAAIRRQLKYTDSTKLLNIKKND